MPISVGLLLLVESLFRRLCPSVVNTHRKFESAVSAHPRRPDGLRLTSSMSLSFFSGLSGLVLPSNLPPHTVSRASAARMGCIEEFSISREIKSVRIFDGAYDTNICDEVTAAAQACIEEKGSFSLCIPGGSVVAALSNLKPDDADWSKMHVFLANEKVTADTLPP